MAPPHRPVKRRKPNPQIEEITFDDAARQEYLSGFHKRKLQRAKRAEEARMKKEKEERRLERARLRQQRREELVRHLRTMNGETAKGVPDSGSDETEVAEESKGCAAPEDDGDEWNGIDDGRGASLTSTATGPPFITNASGINSDIDHEAEYVDEEKYTTVTVAAMDASRDGLYEAFQDQENTLESNSSEAGKFDNVVKLSGTTKRVWANERQSSNKPKKKKKFRYESKVDRKITRFKEKSENRRKATARRAT